MFHKVKKAAAPSFLHLETRLQVATQTTYPSFGWWLGQGATTCWENYSGKPDPSHPPTPTHNHIFLCGGLGEWLYALLETTPLLCMQSENIDFVYVRSGTAMPGTCIGGDTSFTKSRKMPRHATLFSN